ncbi:MAG: UDP-N-acetylmuramoyl-L-alanine--D-glutamate ligase, partial [Candidatus Latescibacteria bacterium]|nr:UDP-N-acetylmuramoyl-L-alanine--D-glutamate ligase [Candidatus Latescibacterota bacterium]
MLPTYPGQRVTIMGLGLFSGGVSTARFFAVAGATVTVTDLKPEAVLRRSMDDLRGLPIRFVLGEHHEEDFIQTDLVVVSPAVNDDSPYLRLARQHGVPLTTEMNLVFERCPARIIGITGSNGKTTTTCLIGAILRAFDDRTRVGGNIGRSLLEEIDDVPPDTTVVLELSSFQLKRLAWIGRSPHVSAVTNLSPNHLDWHGTFEDYADSKQQIIRSQKEDDIAVLNADDARLRDWATVCRSQVFWFSLEREVERGACLRRNTVVFRHEGREEWVCDIRDLQIPGRHNVANVLAAVAAAAAYGVPARTILAAVTTFRGVAHRLEFVAELDGVRYYDDSACTTPESTIIALRALDAPIILIAGGYDKHVEFDELAAEIVQRTKAAVLIGKTAGRLEAVITQRRNGDSPAIVHCGSLKDAVDQSRALAQPGDVVVLSPACASYD